jgi:hypothetical protein
LREGRTSSRSGSPTRSQRALFGFSAADAAGAAAAGSTRVNVRVRRTLAVQFWPLITNWYWPVSSKFKREPLPLRLVITLACRASAADVLQTVRQLVGPVE